MQILPFDPTTATDADWVALNAFENGMAAEMWPDDPPIAVERTITGRTLHSAWIHHSVWLAWSDDRREVCGLGGVSVWDVQHNRHIARVELNVLPAYRRQGIGSRLLGLIADAAAAAGRTMLLGYTESNLPDGNAFAEALGAKAGIPNSTNQLDMRDLDPALMQRWTERAQARAADFRLGFWERAYPDEAMEGMLRMLGAMNDAPRDEDYEEETWAAEDIREWERILQAEGTIRWTAYAQEAATGAYAGYSEIFWRADRPTIAHQGDTAVLPAYRNRGLGRWLKAAMIERIRAERPEVRFIRTGNADSNQPMLNINYEMGFRPYRSWTTYMLDVSQALAKIEARHRDTESTEKRQ
ncbi:MAG: GNAT family N-acetyltransferase [Anaerolineae bacterium]